MLSRVSTADGDGWPFDKECLLIERSVDATAPLERQHLPDPAHEAASTDDRSSYKESRHIDSSDERKKEVKTLM
jgi:hypothetical protein